MSKYDYVLDKMLLSLSVFFLFLILVLGSLSMMLYYKDFYLKEYQKLGVYDDVSRLVNINKSESVILVSDITDNTFKFLKGREDLKYFNSDEKSHMNDVKTLISSLNFIYYSSVLFFIILFLISYFKLKDKMMDLIHLLANELFYSGIAVCLFFVLLFILSVFSFEFWFAVFHLIFFPQGNWMFPSNSLLITIFPEQFFMDILLRIIIIAVFQSVIFIIIGHWLRKQVKLHHEVQRKIHR